MSCPDSGCRDCSSCPSAHTQNSGTASEQPKAKPDLVHQPAHYTWIPGVEVIDITQHLNFCLGNVVKYVLRADRKGEALQDLRKARTYLDIEIKRREQG